MAAIKGVIFDYGGTIDSRGEHWSEVIWKGYKFAQVEVEKSDFRDAYVAVERRLAVERHILPCHNFYDLMSIKMRLELAWLAERGIVGAEMVGSADKVARYCYDYARCCVDEARPTLLTLYQRFPMVLVSNFYGNIESVLADFDLRHFFKTVIESSVVGVRKPDPQIFALGVEALKLNAEQVLVVGDSLRKDIEPAEKIGCHVAWLKGKGWTVEEDEIWHPGIIKRLSDVVEVALTCVD